MPHSTYFPDMAPSDHHVSKPKKWLGGKRFSTDSEIIAAVNRYLKNLDSSTYN